MDKFEQMLGQMAEGIRSDSNWLIENHIRQGREHDERLAQAEQLLRQLLALIVEQRSRFGGYRRDDAAQPRPQSLAGTPREKALAAMRERTNSGEQPNGRAASQG